jgi:hypothetical protein
MRIRQNIQSLKIQPYYETTKQKDDDEKKFVSPLEKPKKREIKNKSYSFF